METRRRRERGHILWRART